MTDANLDLDLIRALIDKDLPAVRSALEAGANPNHYKSEHGNRVPALHYAAASGSVEAIQLLLTAGADPGHRRKKFESDFFVTGDGPSGGGSWSPKEHALWAAAGGGHFDAVELLLPLAERKDIRAALDKAARNGHRRVLDRLLEAGAPGGSRQGWQPKQLRDTLAHAASGGHRDLVQVLLEVGASGETSDGWTPALVHSALIASAMHGVDGIADLLRAAANSSEAGGEGNPEQVEMVRRAEAFFSAKRRRIAKKREQELSGGLEGPGDRDPSEDS